MWIRVILAALIVVLGGAVAKAAPAHPHIVFILADDMGYGDVGAYNPESKIPTPNLDRLAAGGMRFTNAYAGGPLCHPSRYSLMTGQYPFRIDISKWPKQPLIEEGRITLPSLLRERGYKTAMVGKWHLGFEEKGYERALPGGPVDRGFDTFFGIRASTDIPPYFYIRGRNAVKPPSGRIDGFKEAEESGWSSIQGRFWRSGGIAPGLELKDVLPKFTDEAVGVIGKHAGRGGDDPLFLYLAFPAPHTPWLPVADFRGKSGAGIYGDFTVMVDAMIGRVLGALKESGLEDDTIVFFSSDNGPVWYDKDIAKFGHDSAGGLRGMKGDIWEAGQRMPFIVRWPGVVKPGSVSRQTVGFVDVVATAAELTGAKLPRDGAEDSYSFLPVLKGRQAEGVPVHDGLIMHAPIRDLKAIVVGDWKLIDGPNSGGFSDTWVTKVKRPEKGAKGQLYNLREDPGETRNLWDEKPEIVVRLSTRLKKAVADGFTASHAR